MRASCRLAARHDDSDRGTAVTPEQLGAVAGVLIGHAVEAIASRDYYAAERLLAALWALKSDGVFVDFDAPLLERERVVL